MAIKIRLILSFLFFLSFNQHLFADTCTWVGDTDNNWETASNWSCGNVPTTDDDVIIDATIEITISTIIEVGSIAFEQPISLLGTGAITVIGNMNVASPFTYICEVAINVHGNADFGNITWHQNEKNMTLNGVSTWEDGTLWCNDGAQVIVPTDAEIIFENGINIRSYHPVPALVINGTLNKQGEDTLDFEAIYNFVGATINIEEGNLTNYLQDGDNCLIENSTVNISDGARLSIARVINIENTQFNGGEIRVTFGIASFKDGTDCSTTHLKINDGIVNKGFPSPESTVTFGSVEQIGGNFSGNGVGFIVAGNFDFIGGEINGDIEVLGITHITDLTTNAETRGYADLLITGGGTMVSNDKFYKFIIPDNSIFYINCDGNYTTLLDEIRIFGILEKEGIGLLEADNFLFEEETSRIEAIGPIRAGGSMLLGGNLAPGLSSNLPIGIMEVQSNLNCSESNSKIELQLDIDAQGNVIHDQLQVEGDIDLNGTLEVEELSNIPNGTYTIITASDVINDSFAMVNLPTGYSVEYLANAVQLIKYIEPSDLEITINVINQVSCFGGSDGCIDIVAMGGVPPYTYSINPSDFCNLSAGNYTINITDNENTSLTAEVEITEPEELIVDGNQFQIDSIEIIATGGTPPYQYQYNLGDYQEGNKFELFVINEPITYFFYVLDANGCATEFVLTINDVQENGLSNHFTLAPNPSQGTIQVTIDFPTNKDLTLSVFDITGKIVYNTNLLKIEDSCKTSIDLSFLARGTYTLALNDGKQIGVKQVVILAD